MAGRAAPTRRRVLAALVALGVSVAVLVPLGWLVTRPETRAGATLQQVVAGSGLEGPDRAQPDPPAPASGSPRAEGTGGGPGTSTSASAGPLPPVAVRDAAPEAVTAPAEPAPVQVRVPDLGITADVQAVGVQDDGAMVVPASVTTVGWYRHGPAPGSPTGNAVLAGHVDTATQGLGAFARLREVEVGTRVTVLDESGRRLHYDVVGKETISKAALPVDDVFARDGDHLLVLVTCGGPFQPELRSYRDNVVVTAIPVVQP